MGLTQNSKLKTIEQTAGGRENRLKGRNFCLMPLFCVLLNSGTGMGGKKSI
jgi:hypothetical protein